MVSPRGCGGSTFYVVVMDYPGHPTEGIDEWVVGVPLKTSLMASCKTNNYLLNALAAMESEVSTPLLLLTSACCWFSRVASRPFMVIDRSACRVNTAPAIVAAPFGFLYKASGKSVRCFVKVVGVRCPRQPTPVSGADVLSPRLNLCVPCPLA